MCNDTSQSCDDKERLYYLELTRYGVDPIKAYQAARILASQTPDELLSPQEIKLVQDACRIWSLMHQRAQNLNLIRKSVTD